MTAESTDACAAVAVAADTHNNDSDTVENEETKSDEMKVDEPENGQETKYSRSAPQSSLAFSSGGGIPYRDHYSLAYPSSTVRFRSSATSHRVYQGNRSQFVLEERNSQITVKRTRDTTGGTMFLRAVYTIVTVLWTGFLFVFCTQLLIFLVMDLAVYLGGTTGSDVAVGRAIGTLLSFPLYVFGLASALIIAFQFIADTWNGQYLLKTLVFGGFQAVVTEWVAFGFYLGFPLFVMGIGLLSGTPDWWSITAIFWFSSISVFYVLFAAVVIFYEIHACLEIVGNEYDCTEDKRALLKKCILLRQVKTFSGTKSRIYLARGSLFDADSARDPIVEEGVKYHQSLYTRFTKWPFLEKIGMMKSLEEPGHQTFPIEEAQGVRPFVTYTTWSLEKLYCKPRHSWYVAVIKGPAALTRAQMQSSFACSVIGNLLIYFLVIAFLVWFDSGALIIGIVVVVLALLSIPTFRSTLSIYKMTRDLVKVRTNYTEDVDEPEEQDDLEIADETKDDASTEASDYALTGMADSQGVFQVYETYRITQASNSYCWVMLGLEIALLYIWPLVALFVINDFSIGIVFLFVGLFSLLRYYLNAAVVLEEVGNMRDLHGKDEYEKWKNRSRTSDIIRTVSRSRSRGPWIMVLVFFLVVALGLGIGGLIQDDPQEGEGYNVTLVPDFDYERPANSLPYPTCSLDFNAGGPVALSDFTFLSVMAYEKNATKLQEQLDGWFGSRVAVDKPDVVSDFRNQTGRQLSPVTYKLYEFPNITATGDPIGVVGVRGSQNAWDWLTNAQLWSGAYGMQILRSFLPFGFIWNPIFDELVKALSILESESIKRVSYYQETTDFVRWLQESGTYADVKITGHSLGGGLSIITAAQTGVSGIGISGPNALMLRKSLDPPVTEEALDTYTFNVIPDRDLVPTAGGVAKAFENIECTAAPNDPFSCHDVVRSLCEILVTCGTGGRPALCQCVTEYGYAQPISSNGESFEDAC